MFKYLFEQSIDDSGDTHFVFSPTDLGFILLINRSTGEISIDSAENTLKNIIGENEIIDEVYTPQVKHVRDLFRLVANVCAQENYVAMNYFQTMFSTDILFKMIKNGPLQIRDSVLMLYYTIYLRSDRFLFS